MIRKNKNNFSDDSKKLMKRTITRALKGVTGKFEDKLFADMTKKERWAVINGWMRYVLPTMNVNKVEGEIGVIQVEFEKISPAEIAHQERMLEERQQRMIEEKEFIEKEFNLLEEENFNGKYQ